MPKRAKRIEAVRAWGLERRCKWPYLVILNFGYGEMASLNRPSTSPQSDRRAVRVRVIRESDYRRLLKAARGAK